MESIISLSGNVGAEVDFHSGEGWSIARFRIACTPRVIKGGAWTDGETTWMSVKCTNRTAENVKASIGKGDPVVVVGRLRTQRWTDEAGQPQDRLVVEAISVGHDLTRGRSTFHKVERTRVEPTDQDVHSTMDEVHAATGEQVGGQQFDSVADPWQAAPMAEAS